MPAYCLYTIILLHVPICQAPNSDFPSILSKYPEDRPVRHQPNHSTKVLTIQIAKR
jgi:hypothetical protein